VLGILSALAVFIGVYFAIKFAASQKGDILKKIGDKIGKAIGGAGIKAMQKMTEGAVKATAEAATKLPETPESRLSKSLTTEKPTTKPVQVKQAIDKKQLRDLSQFKAQ
jgi:F0F1-type ATP synthase delta subunit